MKVCKEPFENIEITIDGNVYFCCSHDIEGKSIGNIYSQSFEEIWNSQKAIEMRTQILNNNYSYCNPELCYRLSNPNVYFDEKKDYFKETLNRYPKEVKFMHDRECNSNCIFCRKKIYRNSKEEYAKLNKLIDTHFIPILKDAEKIIPNAMGDAFASRHSRDLIKAVAKKYPNIKFELLTNGILATPKIIKDLGIENRMDTVFVSFHAIKRSTYTKLVHNGNFNMVMKNIKYLSDLHNKGILRVLQFNFVVNKYNYKEMKDFIKFARKHNATPSFWEIRDYNEDIHEKYNDLAIHLPTHPEHKKLLEVLDDEIFDTLKEHELFPVLRNLRRKN